MLRTCNCIYPVQKMVKLNLSAPICTYFSKWGIPYCLYKDIYGWFYYDITDSDNIVQQCRSTTEKEAIEEFLTDLEERESFYDYDYD